MSKGSEYLVVRKNVGTPGQKGFYNQYLDEQKQAWTIRVKRVKHETFLQMLKQDCFLF